MRYFIPILFILVVTVVSIMGFRGDLTKNTPLEVFPDMDRQAKYKSQTQNDFYGDKKADRLPVPGTAIRGTALEIDNVFSESPAFSNLAFRTGKIDNDADSWVSKIPDEAAIDMSLMRLGKERYDIHCAICHGTYGNGKGVMKEFLGVAPRNLSDPESPNYLEPAGPIPDGRIFHTIGMGAGSMLGLKDKLSPKERWAIVLYVRMLQSYVSEAQSSAKN
jgi:mono/diheme cytochrome c family protein